VEYAQFLHDGSEVLMTEGKVNHFSELFHFKNDDDDVLDISRMRRDTVRQQTDSVTVKENTNNSENEKKQ
jgi:hypothetical protein